MEEIVEKIKKISYVLPTEIPNGKYDGLWGDYVVRVIIDEVEYEMTMHDGVRGFNVPCTVVVEDGKVCINFA